jgi:hypothetical protein
MTEWGWTNPVLIDESGMIIAGHGRVMAAQSLGYDEAPVMVAVGWSEAQKKAYVIADNKIGELGGWDKKFLLDEIRDLKIDDFDVALTGFDDVAMVDFTAPGKMAKAFDVEAADKEEVGEYLHETSKNESKFPLTFLLDADEFDVWRALKEANGCGDKKLFLLIMEAANA